MLCLIIFILLLASCIFAMSSNSEVRLIISFNRRDHSERIRLSKQDFVSYEVLKKKLCLLLNITDPNTIEVEYFDNSQSRYVSAMVLNEDNFKLKSKSSRILIVETQMGLNNGTQPLRIMGRLFPNIDELFIGSNHIKVAEIENAKLGTGLITWDSSVYLAKYLELNANIVGKKNILELGAGTGVCGIASAYLGAKFVLLTDLEYVLDNLKSNVGSNFNEFPVEGSNGLRNCEVVINSTACHYLNPSSLSSSSSASTTLPVLSSSSSSRYITVSRLEWGNASTYQYPFKGFNNDSLGSDWDVILGADIVWLENLVPLLSHALTALCSHKTLFILSYQVSSSLVHIQARYFC